MPRCDSCAARPILDRTTSKEPDDADRLPTATLSDALSGRVVLPGDPDWEVDESLASVKQALREHHVGDYQNFVEEPVDASRFFDTATWARLREVKALHDPTDVFKGNHHIPPAV